MISRYVIKVMSYEREILWNRGRVPLVFTGQGINLNLNVDKPTRYVGLG
jgi:hypothetical protein